MITTRDGIPVHCSFDELVEVDSVKPNPRNPNTHPDGQLRLLGKLISGHGWRSAITVSNRSGLVVRGHGRLLAARAAKLTEVPVDYQDYDSDELEYADLIADNRIAELANVDRATLKDLLEELDTGAMDMELAGWTEEALERLMSEIHIEGEAGEKATERGQIVCPQCGYLIE